MRKIRIEVIANIVVYTNACNTAWFAVNNWCNKKTKITDNNKKTEIDFINIELVEFWVYTVMSWTDSICKICHK